MKLEEIMDMYGTRSDYMDMHTGYIYKFPEMTYSKDSDTTTVPISSIDNPGWTGYVLLDGDQTKR